MEWVVCSGYECPYFEIREQHSLKHPVQAYGVPKLPLAGGSGLLRYFDLCLSFSLINPNTNGTAPFQTVLDVTLVSSPPRARVPLRIFEHFECCNFK